MGTAPEVLPICILILRAELLFLEVEVERMGRACVGGCTLKRQKSHCLTMRSGGVPDLPSPRLRAAAAGRHSPLRLRQ